MKKIVLVYDDTVKVPQNIKNIIGKSSYGKIILKRRKVFDRMVDIVNETNNEIEIINIEDKNNLLFLYKKIDVYENGIKIFHLFSNYTIKDLKSFKILLQKIPFINETYKIVQENKIIGILFNKVEDYKVFLKMYNLQNENIEEYINYNKIDLDCFFDISNYNSLLTYISGSFDSRFFNNLERNQYVVTKKSTKKKKIKQEYMYYQLLPDNMKKWMVMPYDYKENDDTAQYTMERLHMTDIAIRWTHKAISIDEFLNILDKTFYYISQRSMKKITKTEYEDMEDKLYLEKVNDRIEELKKDKLFTKFDMFIKSGTEFNSIDEIFDLYKQKYERIRKRNKNYVSVIGHGDLCFANMLYSNETELLKLIDPKGALCSEELWTNPYYDIAKLSHSICGNYDFFNCSSYRIFLNNDLKYELEVYNDNTKYKKIFKEYIEKKGYNYYLVRLYEASLFLSMLPLHMDYPNKVFGFLLNAINILKEIEKDV